ncbi:g4843 [Coccomyxa elongata]
MGGRSSKNNMGAYDADDDDVPGRGCCGCFAKGVLSMFIAIVFLATIGLSVAALILGKDASWTIYDSNGAKPEYRIKTGWFTYHVGGDNAPVKSLRDLSFPVWALGMASAAALGATGLLAVLYLCITIFGSAGRHIRIVAFPVGLLLGGVLAAFYVMAALAVRDLSYDAIKESVMIRPDYGWCFGMGAALLWLISGFFSCCIPPRRSKDYVKQPSPRNSQTGNPVYRVRTYSNSNAELDNSEPLTGKQPGVLNVEAPSAELEPATQSSTSKSWFKLGKGKSPLAKQDARGDYRDRTAEIAKRYGDKNV